MVPSTGQLIARYSVGIDIRKERAFMFAVESLYESPNALAPHYSRFDVSHRLLLSGHSHQAWPDCSFDAQVQAWRDAALYVDDKWQLAFEKADAVRRGYARLMEDSSGQIALAESTHALIVRFLSSLPLGDRPRIVTTAGEFHSMRRQLDALDGHGLDVVRVPDEPVGDVAQRLCEAVDDRTSAVMVSVVYFRSARIVPGLADVFTACHSRGAELLVDAYHALNVMPFPLASLGLEDAFVTGGGYKYCQLGESNAFLRYPATRKPRPLITGWFAEFDDLSMPAESGATSYQPGPMRFAGGTYDPVSHYRAAAVFEFFEHNDLAPQQLRAISQHQVGRLRERFDALDCDPARICRDHDVALDQLGGFLVLRSDRAGVIRDALRERGVYCDARGDALRLGPAPYLCDEQLDDAIDRLKQACRAVYGE